MGGESQVLMSKRKFELLFFLDSVIAIKQESKPAAERACGVGKIRRSR